MAARGLLLAIRCNGSAIGNMMGSVGQRIAAGFVGGVAGQWAGPGGKANYGSVFASTLGNVIGDGIASGIASDRNPSNSNYRNEMDRDSDAYSPAFNYNYRNGSDVESDQAYEARRNWVTQVDANTIVDNRPLQSSPGANALYDQLVSMMTNPPEVDTTGATRLAAGPTGIHNQAMTVHGVAYWGHWRYWQPYTF